jgi:hypothetical protein
MLMIVGRIYKIVLVTGFCYGLLPSRFIETQFKIFRLKSA